MVDFNGQRQNPTPFPRRFLRLLSMGCGISKFDPKEVVEASPNTHNKYSTNCFTGESKSLIDEGGGGGGGGGGARPCSYSTEERPRKGDSSQSAAEEATTTKMKVHRRARTTRKEIIGSEDSSDRAKYDQNDDDDEENCRGICRGGSPSFREYCVDSDSRSRSFESEDNDCEENSCKRPNESTINPEKGSESEMGKKEGRGKGLRNAINRGKSGGVRNILNGSRRQNPNFPSPSHKLLAKAS